MSVYEWMHLIVIEGMKLLLVGHYFFGYEWNRSKTRLLLWVCLPLFIAIKGVGNINALFLIKYFWEIMVVLCLFQGKLLDKFKAFFVIWFLISFIDTILGIPFIIVFHLKETDVAMQMVIGCFGGLCIGLLSWRAKRIQKLVKEFWRGLASWEYLILLPVLWLLAMIIGGMQGYLYHALSESKRELIYVLGVVAAIIFLLLYLWLFYVKRSKERLEKINQLNYSYITLQRKYYEDSLKQYEDMRGFRHDINNHLYILSELCREGKDAELKEYIAKMTESYDRAKGIHTGNFVADCIISHAIRELKEDKDFSFQLEGHFPEEFPMEDIDFCILLSNLLNNAVEALEKEEKKLLRIEVKRYREWLYLVIANSITRESVDFSHTSKQGQNHGYGISNVRYVVEKYQGTVNWDVKCSMAEVRVKLTL